MPVLAVTLIISVIGATFVATLVQSVPLQANTSAGVYARRALEAGENAYVTAINANPSLAQCSTATNGSGTCKGIDYGQWNLVSASAPSGGNNSDNEYYAFGNPQPTFSKTTNALTNLTVQVVGAAQTTTSTNGYLFDTESMNLSSTNGFLNNVWWSNFESYSQTGNYGGCTYNWQTPNSYDVDNANNCSDSNDFGPVYFANGDYLFGPTFTNDSVS